VRSKDVQKQLARTSLNQLKYWFCHRSYILISELLKLAALYTHALAEARIWSLIFFLELKKEHAVRGLLFSALTKTVSTVSGKHAIIMSLS